jgi:phosphatidylserine decarboxylase
MAIASRRLLIAALRWLPKGLLSHAAGRVAELRLPQPLQRWEIELFARAVGADFAEMRDPLESFTSLQAFFTRHLKPGMRPIDPDPAALVAPCDGYWGEAGIIACGRLLQVKGRSYSVAALLRDDDAAHTLEGGAYATFYLAPQSYHRFHAPCAMRVEQAQRVPGELWPVNRAGLEGVADLFAVNERVWVRAAIEPSGAPLCLVPVGATMVGKVRVDFDDLPTRARRGIEPPRCYDPPVRYEKGAEWGRFEFGSSIVLLAAPGALRLDAQPSGSPLRLGTRIGTLHS